MKKIILALALLAGAATAANAQMSPQFGLRGGISAATLSGKGSDGNSFGLAGLGGITAGFGLSDLISIQPELLYNLKGTQFKDAAGKDSKVRLDLHYVDLPILIRVNADGPYFEAGPQVGYLIAASAGGVNKDLIDADNFQRFQFGYVAGVGYKLTSGLDFGVRYNGGINSIGKDDQDGDQVRNQVFSFVVGYSFGGDK